MAVNGVAGAAGPSLLDTRGIAKPKDFSGDPGDWQPWVFGFRSYIGLLSHEMEDGMVQVENRNTAPDPIAYGEDTLSLARQLYHLLVTTCTKGRAV